MTKRPGAAVAKRPLHFVVVSDTSGSMAGDGKMQALNTALRETLPHLVDVDRLNPHSEVLVRSLTFSTGARWHIETPTPVDQLIWRDLSAGGYTDLGAALDLLTAELRMPPMPQRALPPALLLISDGLPTDDYQPALQRLLAEPWGERAVRMAVGIGRDADHDVLQAFIASPDLKPVTANNPEQLVRMIRWASVHASRVASTLTTETASTPDPDPLSDTVW